MIIGLSFKKSSIVEQFQASLLRTLFASFARAHERVRLQNLRVFPQTKLDGGINAPLLVNKHGGQNFYYIKILFILSSLIKK